MTLPESTVEISDTPAAKIAAADSGAWFMVGQAERGPIDTAVLSGSLAQWVNTFGARFSDPTLYDCADAFFREGGSVLYTGRVVGSAPVAATANLAAASGTALVCTAKSVGEWGNDVDVVADATGSTFTLVVKYLNVAVESPDAFATTQEAVDWAEANSDYVTLAVGTGADPVDGTANLAGGDDNNGSLTDANWVTALNLFTEDYGPGQVSAPGRTTTQGYKDVLSHALAHKRVALLDGADTATVATLTSASTGLRDQPGDRFGGMFAPWAVIPGLAIGTTRTIPYSAIQAGMIARSDAEGANPNVAAAALRGHARYAIDLSQSPWSDANREILNDAGVNVALIKGTDVVTMGDRTLVNPNTNPNWLALSNSRLMMAVCADVKTVLDAFLFRQIDGRGFTIAELSGRLKGEALMPFFIDGALYGATPEQAFAVNVGADVNTPETISAGELHAAISLRVSPRAEIADTVIVKVPTTESV